MVTNSPLFVCIMILTLTQSYTKLLNYSKLESWKRCISTFAEDEFECNKLHHLRVGILSGSEIVEGCMCKMASSTSAFIYM